MLNFFRTTENCSRILYAFVLFASLLEQHAHVHVENPFEMVINHINPRRSVARGQ